LAQEELGIPKASRCEKYKNLKNRSSLYGVIGSANA